MKRIGPVFIKNAISNLIRGGATAAVAILLPRFLTRSLDADHFAAWSLILQIAAYASYLDFGLQTAIARFLAQALELEQRDRQTQLVSTAATMLTLAGLLAFAILATVVWQLPHVFNGVPPGLLSQFRGAALLLSLSACIQLPLSTYTGVLIGMHRNEIPAIAIGSSRIAGAIAAIVAAQYTQSLPILALCIAIPNVIAGLLQLSAVQLLLAEGRVRIHQISRSIGKELLNFCAGLTVFSFGMLLVGGLDVTVVGHFQFADAGYYSIAAMLIAFITGLSNSALSALMAPVAALHARGDSLKIRQIIVMATSATLMVNLLLSLIIFLMGSPMLKLWVGTAYAAKSLPILEILVVAQTLRLIAAPYTIMLISIGEQSKGIAAALCEGFVNLIASIVGMIWLGPIGVALGTLLGALAGLIWVFGRLMPSVLQVKMTFPYFVQKAISPAVLPCLPLLVPLIARMFLGRVVTNLITGICLCLTCILMGIALKRSRGGGSPETPRAAF